MPAATYPELFAFESNINDAFSRWFDDQFLTLEVQGGVESLPDDWLGIETELGAVTGHYNPAPGGAATPEYDQYTFGVKIVVRTRRNDPEGSSDAAIDTLHHEMVANVRTWLSALKVTGSAFETYLDHYAIEVLRPAGTSKSIDGVFDESELTFEGQFSILQSAWPVV